MKPRGLHFIIFSLTLALGASIMSNIHYRAQLNGITRESYIDTIPIPVPVPRDSVVLRYVTATLPAVPDTIPFHDTVTITKTDSVKVLVPISQKVYEGEQYTAWVSGYRQSLDSIQLRIPTTVITRQEKTPWVEFSFGLQAGAAWFPQQGVKPYLGAGIQVGIPFRKFHKKK